MNRSTSAAATRAAQAALTAEAAEAAPARPQDFDRYLLIDDGDDFTSEIHVLLRECSPRGVEVLS